MPQAGLANCLSSYPTVQAPTQLLLSQAHNMTILILIFIQ